MRRSGCCIDVATLQEQFEGWRQTRRPGLAIPEELWGQAAQLGAQQGVLVVSRALRLNYSDLKKRVAALGGNGTVKPAVASFVELFPAPSASISRCLVEVESPRGAKLRVTMESVTPTAVTAIIRDFVE